MKLKASCDVESIEDFSKYYGGAFVRTRDERVAHIEIVRPGTNQIIMSFPNLDPRVGQTGELKVFGWPEVQQMVVFGKVQTGNVMSRGSLYYVSQSNNRVSTRGYRDNEYNWHPMGIDHGIREQFNMMNLSPDRIHELAAIAVLYPTYSPFYTWHRNHIVMAVSPLWSMTREQSGKVTVRRRAQQVGIFDEDKRSVGLFPTEYKMYSNSLTRNHGVACHELS
ncbi:MAG: hypothetical protein E6Q97_11435 [Desulfurellales bacterium]|nr:MAG: hypothetical protein E6Q97_11435 [Desulfurellales bacterium]